ncbi:mas-related G-protein coupled receptor member X2-like [Anomaloglossus baeobatrachus]|uniref:mas-related G-protein coupled receptor member X2-like n=1 Tax=Anomaloglossus baeobatrachus TaxID=238106 RepID=UPI003F4FDFD8
MSLNITATSDPNSENNGGYSTFAYIHFTIAASIALLLCLIGLVGNIIVLWFLCFKIQKNKFTVYSINLAVAYFLFLLFSVSVLALNINTLNNIYPDFQGKDSSYLFIEIFYDSSLYAGMFILTAISLEICISVKLAVWHKCRRPKSLSVITCVILWSIGCMESLLENLLCTADSFTTQTIGCTAIQLVTFASAIVVCLPIMVTSCLILLLHIKRKYDQQASTELYAFIISAVTVFIISVIPFSFLWFLMYFHLIPIDVQKVALYFASIYGTVLNCTITPYLYIMAEIKWRAKSYKPERDSNTDITTCKTIYGITE